MNYLALDQVCPFHKKLVICRKMSFFFSQTDNSRLVIHHVLLLNKLICLYMSRIYLTNLEVTEFSFLRKSTKRKSLIRPTVWDFLQQ